MRRNGLILLAIGAVSALGLWLLYRTSQFGLATEAVSEEVSRAGFRSEVADLQQVVLEMWDRSARVSRAGLRRILQALPGRSRGKLGRGGTEDPLCHAQASSRNSIGI